MSTPSTLRIAGDLTPQLLDQIRAGLGEPGEWDATVVAALVAEVDRLRIDLATAIHARDALRDGFLDVSSQRDQALQRERAGLRVLAHFVDDEPCQFDHHGACQAHGVSGPPCRNAMARQLLGMDDAARAGA